MIVIGVSDLIYELEKYDARDMVRGIPVISKIKLNTNSINEIYSVLKREDITEKRKREIEMYSQYMGIHYIMTSFALILWVYTQKGTAMTVSLMTFFNYIPYIIVSLFAGTFVDNHSKKKIMLVSDSIAAICSVAMFLLSIRSELQIWNIYLVNFIIGFMHAFQGPASQVAIGKVVPKEKLGQVSGMNSFSGNLVAVLSPVFAASLFALGGLNLILVIDLMSFIFAFLVLLFVLKIPEDISHKVKKKSVFIGCKEGLQYLKQNNGIFIIIITMALLNFFLD